MFDAEEHKQLEFFEDIASLPARKNKRLGSPFNAAATTDFKISYEKIILGIIIFILTLTIIFSLGVEQGKELRPNISSPEIVSSIEPSEKKEDHPAKEQTKQVSKEEKKQIDNKTKPVTENKIVVKKTEIMTARNPQNKISKEGFFTIQVVTYKDRQRAKTEKMLIEKSGLRAFIIKSGKYFLVCAGDFDEISAAQNKLPSLRKKYNDCFVKKIKKNDIYLD